MFFEKVMGGEDHAGGADAALSSTFFEEALLDGMKLFVNSQPFDRSYLRAFGLQDGDQAGINQSTVHQHSAGSALAFSAAFFRSREVQIFAQDVEESLHRRSLDAHFAVVD